MSMTNKTKRSLALALGLALTGSAGATPLYLTNADFEVPVLADGVETSPYNVPGWVEYEPSYAWQWEVYNPAAAYIPAEAHGGQNVVMSYGYNPATQYLEQTLTNTLQLNTRYTLAAWAADPDGHVPQNSVRLLLYAGSTLLGTGTVQPTATDTWAEGSLVYETGSIHPQAGQLLKVRIMLGVADAYRVLIDDVSLDATYVPPVVQLYTWDGSVNNWNTPHWNPGAVAWPGAGNDASVTNGEVKIPEASGAFQANSLWIAGGTVSITGANGFAGVLATTMGPGGILTLNGVSSTLGALTLAGGTLAGTNPDPTTGSWQLSTDVNVIGDGVTSTIGAPQVALADAGRIFAVGGTATLNVSGTLRAAFGYEGLVKNGSGTLILASGNTYDGATAVNAGTLVVNNPTGSATGSGDVTVAAGSTLAGSGQIAGSVTVQSGATLAPGASLGTLVISNTLTLSGNTVMEVTKTAGVITNDRLRGMTYLAYGGTLFVNLSGQALAVGDTIQLFAADSYYGEFAALSPGTPGPGLQWDPSGLANGVLGVAAEVVFGSLPIVNAGFENPVLADGKENASAYTVPGWVEFDEQYAWAWDIYNPSASDLPAEAHGGQNVLKSIGYRPATQYVEQQLADTLKLDTRYTLSAWVADPDVKSGGTYINNTKLILFAGTNEVGTVMISPSANDIWTKGTFVYESGPSHPDAGQPLKIRIMWGSRSSNKVFMDDVSLTAVPMFPYIWSISRRANGSMSFTATGEPGQSYSLMSSTNVALPLANWTVLTSGTIAESPFTLNDLTATNALRRFYYLRMP
jgi:autotransporter-associated beta strand protein